MNGAQVAVVPTERRWARAAGTIRVPCAVVTLGLGSSSGGLWEPVGGIMNPDFQHWGLAEKNWQGSGIL
ncbi:hypothetical protein P7K49_014265, partial [Saguinus oedipus]